MFFSTKSSVQWHCECKRGDVGIGYVKAVKKKSEISIVTFLRETDRHPCGYTLCAKTDPRSKCTKDLPYSFGYKHSKCAFCKRTTMTEPKMKYVIVTGELCRELARGSGQLSSTPVEIGGSFDQHW